MYEDILIQMNDKVAMAKYLYLNLYVPKHLQYFLLTSDMIIVLVQIFGFHIVIVIIISTHLFNHHFDSSFCKRIHQIISSLISFNTRIRAIPARNPPI